MSPSKGMRVQVNDPVAVSDHEPQVVQLTVP
jgi:hypothetical protein